VFCRIPVRIAPEILTGKQHCTERVDIFSMGVVMWEIITGERPQRGNLRAPRVPEECPQDVADLLAACLR
jgi:serine/threonine protein kinase